MRSGGMRRDTRRAGNKQTTDCARDSIIRETSAFAVCSTAEVAPTTSCAVLTAERQRKRVHLLTTRGARTRRGDNDKDSIELAGAAGRGGGGGRVGEGDGDRGAECRTGHMGAGEHVPRRRCRAAAGRTGDAAAARSLCSA